MRLATFELAILLLKSLVYSPVDGHSFLQDDHLAAIEGAREEATLQMRNFYKVWEKVCFTTNVLNVQYTAGLRLWCLMCTVRKPMLNFYLCNLC